MAYKFQVGAAILSGSTKFEERVELAGGLEFSGSVDSVSVANDHFMFLDGGATGASKVESIADLMTAVAGAGLGDSSGVLAVGAETNGGIAVLANGVKMDLADLSAAAVDVANDSIAILDAGDSSTKKESIADLMTSVAGAGLGAASGVLSLDIDELSALGGTGLNQTQDHFVFSDNGTEKKITFSNLEDAIFGNVSGDIAVAAGGAATIQADAVESGMLNDNVISGQTELASDGLVAADEMMISDGGTLKKIGVDNLFKDGPGLLTAAAVDVAADHIMFLDGGASGDAKIESLVDLATGFAGNGLTASGGALAVQVSGAIKVTSDKLGLTGSVAGAGLLFEGGADSLSVLEVKVASNGGISKTAGSSNKSLAMHIKGLTAADIDVATDFLAFMDESDGNDATKKESIADLMTAVAGSGLAASSGVLAVGVDDTGIEINSDALRLKDNGVTLAKMAGLARGSVIVGDSSGDPSALSLGSQAQLLISKDSDLVYVSLSGDATIDKTGALTIASDAVESGMLNDNVISGQTELAQGGLAAADELLISDGGTIKRYGVDSLAKDSGALTTEAALTVADDYVLFLDGGASGETKKEQFSDIITNVAGQGLSGDSGVLNVRQDVALKADGGTLAAGVNYFANASADASVNLPASPTVGDVVIAKAGNLTSGATITIGTQGSHAIDGADSVTIESPFGAVTCVYVVTNDWRLI